MIELSEQVSTGDAHVAATPRQVIFRIREELAAEVQLSMRAVRVYAQILSTPGFPTDVEHVPAPSADVQLWDSAIDEFSKGLAGSENAAFSAAALGTWQVAPLPDLLRRLPELAKQIFALNDSLPLGDPYNRLPVEIPALLVLEQLSGNGKLVESVTRIAGEVSARQVEPLLYLQQAHRRWLAEHDPRRAADRALSEPLPKLSDFGYGNRFGAAYYVKPAGIFPAQVASVLRRLDSLDDVKVTRGEDGKPLVGTDQSYEIVVRGSDRKYAVTDRLKAAGMAIVDTKTLRQWRAGERPDSWAHIPGAASKASGLASSSTVALPSSLQAAARPHTVTPGPISSPYQLFDARKAPVAPRLAPGRG